MCLHCLQMLNGAKILLWTCSNVKSQEYPCNVCPQALRPSMLCHTDSLVFCFEHCWSARLPSSAIISDIWLSWGACVCNCRGLQGCLNQDVKASLCLFRWICPLAILPTLRTFATVRSLFGTRCAACSFAAADSLWLRRLGHFVAVDKLLGFIVCTFNQEKVGPQSIQAS